MPYSSIHDTLSDSLLHAINYSSDTLLHAINYSIDSIHSTTSWIPGSTPIFNYIKKSHQNDPFRILLELFLVVFLVWYYSKRSEVDERGTITLTQKVFSMSDVTHRSFIHHPHHHPCHFPTLESRPGFDPA